MADQRHVLVKMRLGARARNVGRDRRMGENELKSGRLHRYVVSLAHRFDQPDPGQDRLRGRGVVVVGALDAPVARMPLL